MIDKVEKDLAFQWFQIQTGDFFKPTTDLDRPFLYSLLVKQFFHNFSSFRLLLLHQGLPAFCISCCNFSKLGGRIASVNLIFKQHYFFIIHH